MSDPNQPPHADDFWISTDDVLDYARWLDRRVRELDDVVLAGLRSPQMVAPASFFSLEWIPWVTNWRVYRQELEGSWWDRVNAWERLRVWHAELRELAARARAQGLAASDPGAPPSDLAALTSTLEEVREAALPTGAVVAGVALGVLALAVVLRR